MGGGEQDEAWADEARTRAVVRVITGLAVVIVLGAIVGMVYVVFG